MTRTADPEILELFIPQSVNFYADNYRTGHIYGEVKNTSDTDAAEVVLELKIYDKDRNLVKKLKVTVRDIPSGQVRSFDVPTGVYKEAYTAEAQVVEVAY